MLVALLLFSCAISLCSIDRQGLRVGHEVSVVEASIWGWGKKAPPKPVVPATEYTVVGGDTLGSIATRHGTTWEKLWDLNRDRISDPNIIHVGQRIRIIGKPVTPIVVKVLSRAEKIDKLARFMFKTSQLVYMSRELIEEHITQQKKELVKAGFDSLFTQRKNLELLNTRMRELEIWYLAEAIIDTAKNDETLYRLVGLAWQESHFVNRMGKMGEVSFFQFLPSTIKERFQLDDIGLVCKLDDLRNNSKMATELALEMMTEYKWQWRYWNHGEDFQFHLNNKIYWFSNEWRK
jgi:LysM repeat protein